MDHAEPEIKSLKYATSGMQISRMSSYAVLRCSPKDEIKASPSAFTGPKVLKARGQSWLYLVFLLSF